MAGVDGSCDWDPVTRAASCSNGASATASSSSVRAEEGDQSLGGGGLLSDDLGRPGATWAGLLGQLGVDEEQ